MDAILRSGGKLFLSSTIEISLLLLVTVMAETIPLRTDLRVELQYIVIDGSRSFVLDKVVERCTSKTWFAHSVDWPIGRDSYSIFDLLGCCFCRFGGQ